MEAAAGGGIAAETDAMTMIKITDGIAIDDREIQKRFVRAMGPDGQNANRAATAVELRLNIKRSSLPRSPVAHGVPNSTAARGFAVVR